MGANHVNHADQHNTWIGRPLRRFLRGLGGHELMRSYSPGRICLRCVSCACESPGWTLREPRQPIVSR